VQSWAARRASAQNGLKVLSRLGSEYLLSFGKQKIELPKKEVVSWSAGPSSRGQQIHDGCKVFMEQHP
jgi:hypothetical protein